MYQRTFEDQLEERVNVSLKALDDCYTTICVVANKPVFFDSPEVRTVVGAVQRARDAVLYVIEVFDDVEIDDNTDAVKLREIPTVGSEPAFEPKRIKQPVDAKKVQREQRMQKLINAVNNGQMQVLNQLGSHEAHIDADGHVRPDPTSTTRLQAALSRLGK